VYFGEAQTHLDNKGRMTLPRRFRDIMHVLGHEMWLMTRGFDNCVFLFHRDAWNSIRDQVSKYSAMNAKAVDFRRLFFGSVAEGRPDRQGRMALPTHLREYAGLTEDANEAVVVGVDDHLELWSLRAWRAFKDRNDAAYKEMAAQLFVGDLGLDTVGEEKGKECHDN